MNMILYFRKGSNFCKRFNFFFKGIKFKYKLFISYIIVIIIPMFVLGFYSYNQARSFLLNEAKQGITESVHQISENLDSNFKRYNSIINFVIYNNQVIQIINNKDDSYYGKYVSFVEILDPFFGNILSLNPEMESMVIYTANDTLEERADSIQSMNRIKAKTWYKKVMKNGQVQWLIDNQTLVGLCKFYVPLKNAPESLLYVKMRNNSVFNISMKTKEDYNIYIMDNENNIIYNSININDSRLSGVGKSLTNFTEGEVKINNVDCMLIKSVVPETGWTLYCVTSVSSITTEINKTARVTLFIILGCLIILLIISWIFSGKLVKRLNNLNKKMKSVEDGNLQLEVSSDFKDEIGELTNRFAKMMKNINILINEVYQSKIIQKDAEMKALQAQINPHFLYNTLSLINWKAIQIDAMEISLIIRNVSRFYRTMLNKGKNVISITDEVSNMKYYLEIQMAMHNNGFDIEYCLDDEIYQYSMIKIILQPIVENAIVHGIDKKVDGRGKLVISGLVKEGCIVFIINDNGPGMEKDILDTIFLQDLGGYGLKNVQERLKILFGDEYGVFATSEKDEGTSITIRIPCNRD